MSIDSTFIDAPVFASEFKCAVIDIPPVRTVVSEGDRMFRGAGVNWRKCTSRVGGTLIALGVYAAAAAADETVSIGASSRGAPGA